MNDNPPFRELMPSFYIVCTTVALFGKKFSFMPRIFNLVLFLNCVSYNYDMTVDELCFILT